MRDQVPLYQRDCDDDQGGLEQERGEQGNALLGADVAAVEREEQRADEEGDDGDERLEPAPWFAGWEV